MSGYVVCPKKRNAPRVNVLVCTRKCEFKDECRAFLDAQASPADTDPVVAMSGQTVAAPPAP